MSRLRFAFLMPATLAVACPAFARGTPAPAPDFTITNGVLDGFGELGGSNLELDLYSGRPRQVASGGAVDAGLLSSGASF